ncbi:MAG: peptide chain release factor N(5)-glutamine methyltransferase [Clostridia bacterium]|nr:peptide chain release factor N(5)-glutamine methyltransferase [Clostridia bacterium]
MTPRELLRALTAELRNAGVPDPEIDASLLLSHVTGQNALNLRLDSWSQISAADEAAVRCLCDQRKVRIPLQYLTGVQSFLGRDFHVDDRVLIPRPETELLAELAIVRLKEYASCKVRALDLCCGSGCLAVSMALAVPHADVHATDLSEGALAVTRMNADAHSAGVTLHQGDLFDALPDGTRYHLIVSNPPYIPAQDCLTLQAEVLREPHMALDGGADGFDFYRRIAREAPRFLHDDGTLLMEVGHDQAEAVMRLCTNAGLKPVAIHEDYQHIQRMVEARL